MNKKIDLGFLSIGGREWKKSYCQCDPDVGMSPCHYCAEFAALQEADRLQSTLDTANQQIMRMIKDYRTHEKNYMAVVERVTGGKSENNYILPTDAACILEGQINKRDWEIERLRDMIVRFCEANVQAADTWKRREDIAPLFAVAEEVAAALKGEMT